MQPLNRHHSRRPITQFGFILLLALAVRLPSYAQRPIPPETATLQSCVGQYQASADTVITVRQSGDRLLLEVNSGSPMEFSSESKDRFVHPQTGTKISFVRDDQGKVTELVLHRGGDHPAKRITDRLPSEEIQTVDINGTTFRAVISGEGKTPVVLVSGIGNWAKVAAGIGTESRTVRYEPDEAGAQNRSRLDVQAQARLLHDLLGALQITRPCLLVGHSFDGALIRIYADRYPEDVAGLVLVDPFDEGFVDWLKANQPKNYERFRQQATEKYVSNWNNLLDGLREARVPTGGPVVLLTAGRRQTRKNDALEKNIKSAELEGGAAAVMKAHQAWIGKVRNGRHVVVPEASHEIPSEQPSFVIEAIQRSLREMGQKQE